MKYLTALLLLIATPAQAAVVLQMDMQGNVTAQVGSNGTWNGDTLTSTTGPKPTGLYPLANVFNGTNNYMTLPSNSFGAGNDFAVTCWCEWDASTGIVLGQVAALSQAILKSSDTAIQVRDSTATTRTYAVPSLGTDNWCFLMVTRDTSNNVRVYINGTESSTGSQTLTGTFGTFTVGIRNGTYLDGQVAGLKVYDDDQSANAASIYATENASTSRPIISYQPIIVQ